MLLLLERRSNLIRWNEHLAPSKCLQIRDEEEKEEAEEILYNDKHKQKL